ncbi:MAG: ArsA-related P-loop ATPase [Myxococcota bacterium]
MSATIDELLEQASLLVTVGPGGVGKTTTAAALALRAAERGRRVAVLTIDPARRLADALGLDGLDDELRPVAVRGEGTLVAAMLDTKASYDALIDRITTGEARDRILRNRVYGAFSKTLARSHAYVASERLYDVRQRGGAELIVLDTPPTRSALDILEAPSRLAQLLDERVLRLLLDQGAPRSLAGASFEALAQAGGAAALRVLARIAGQDVTGELRGFLEALAHLRDGFRERAEVVQGWLADPTTVYALVTSPAPTSLDDARALGQTLSERHRPPGLLLFNRAFVPEPGTRRPVARPEARPVPPGLEATARALEALRAGYVLDRVAAWDALAALRRSLAPEAPAFALAEAPGDLRTLDALRDLLVAPLPLDALGPEAPSSAP